MRQIILQIIQQASEWCDPTLQKEHPEINVPETETLFGGLSRMHHDKAVNDLCNGKS